MALMLLKLKGDVVQEEKEGITINEPAIFAEGKGVITIGRGKDSDIRTNCERVSRKHCSLIKKDDGWHITDHKSTSGTYISRESKFLVHLISGEFPLKELDQIFLGGLMDTEMVLVLRFVRA